MTHRRKTQLSNEIWEALAIAEEDGMDGERGRCTKIVERALRIDPTNKGLKSCLEKIDPSASHRAPVKRGEG